MYKDTTYKEKFSILKEWAPQIIDEVKKELKSEHLRQDYIFVKKYFGKPVNKITNEELIEGYVKAIQEEENGEKIAEFVMNRWMMKASDTYGFFEKELTRINPEFTEISELSAQDGNKLIEDSSKHFGYLNTYLFSVINSVQFSEKQFKELSQKALTEKQMQKEELSKLQETKSFESLKQEFEQKLIKMEDKYSKKLEGLEKKYFVDTQALKKQVANLQRKLNA